MKITVFGTGYVGLVTGVCFAEWGNDVICVDVKPEKIACLQAGTSPFYEPGMDELLSKNIKAKRISFTTDIAESIKHGDYIFIAVGTPSGADGSAHLQHVYDVARSIGRYLDHYAVVVDKSTVPVGTGDKVADIVRQELTQRKVHCEFDVVSNPEFLKQGDAIADFMHADRVIIGVDNVRSLENMKKIYEPLHAQIISMDVRSAELTKYAANAFLATKISFMNDISLLAERLGADVDHVRIGIGSDKRIGPNFLFAGCGYGGSCFP